jgi:hypothetical protein
METQLIGNTSESWTKVKINVGQMWEIYAILSTVLDGLRKRKHHPDQTEIA